MKAILRTYIGRIDYDPDKNRARVGFCRLPTQAQLAIRAPESTRISVVAGTCDVIRHIRAALARKLAS